MAKGRNRDIDDQQLSLDALWAEPERARDEQVRQARQEPLGDDRSEPLRGSDHKSAESNS